VLSLLPIASLPVRAIALCICIGAVLGLTTPTGRAESLLLVEADTGKVLHAENASYPWYPASVTKLMTAYVTLKAVREGRIKLNSLITVSPVAVAQQPSKMGFPTGAQVTVDDALKMLMVKSANDIAVVLAEGVSGSVEAFADEMNRASQRLGMTQSTWVNPNGLPAEGQVTSARDMAMLARALIREFPEHELYWRVSSIKLGRRVFRNYNKLIDRYPGADGMKTGFICASGYNLVASATRNGRRLISVVLGSPSGAKRAETAAQLLEKGFSGGGLSWLIPSLGSVDSLQPIAAAPPNLRDEICGKGRKVRTDHAAEEEGEGAVEGTVGASAFALFQPALKPNATGVSLLGPLTPSMAPIPVSVTFPKRVPATPAPDAAIANVNDEAKAAPNGGTDGSKPAAKKRPPIRAAATTPADLTAEKPKSAAPKVAKPKPAAKPAASKPKAAATTPAEKPAQKPKAAVPAQKPKAATTEAPDKPKPAAKPKASSARTGKKQASADSDAGQSSATASAISDSPR
jgi:D-alanyl-D-alanine carboxypeptidase